MDGDDKQPKGFSLCALWPPNLFGYLIFEPELTEHATIVSGARKRNTNCIEWHGEAIEYRMCVRYAVV